MKMGVGREREELGSVGLSRCFEWIGASASVNSLLLIQCDVVLAGCVARRRMSHMMTLTR